MESLTEYDDLAFKVNAFSTLINMEWKVQLSSNVLRTLAEAKKNKIKLLPLMQDVKLLSNYIKAKIATCSQRRSANNSNCSAYRDLRKLVLTSLILCNRKRRGDVSKMTLEDYFGMSLGSQLNDIGPSQFKKKVSAKSKCLEITKKSGMTVPILMDRADEQFAEPVGALPRTNGYI